MPSSPAIGSTREAHVWDVVAAQAGVVTRAQLRAAGWSSRTIGRQVAAGRWRAVGAHVLVATATPDDLCTASLVAWHRIGGAGVLTGPSAIRVAGLHTERLWRDVALGDIPWLICLGHVRIGVRAVRRQPPRGMVYYGVRVAHETDALMDMLRLLPEGDSNDLADRAAQVWGPAHLATALQEALDTLGPARGIGRLRRHLAGLADNAHSEGERRLAIVLAQAGIVGWRANVWLSIDGHRFCGDVVFEQERLVLEVDGRAWHGQDRWESGLQRDNSFALAGWRLLHFSWRQLTEDPERVIAEILAALQMARG